MDGKNINRRKFHLHDGKKGAALAVRVVPDSHKDEISAILEDGTLQISLSSSLEQDEVNQMLAKFLAKVFKVPSSKIEVVAGFSGQDKLVAILDMDAELAHKKIEQYL